LISARQWFVVVSFFVPFALSLCTPSFIFRSFNMFCCLIEFVLIRVFVFPQIRRGAFSAGSADERQAGRSRVIAAATVPTAAAAAFVSDQSQQLRIRYLYQMNASIAPSDGEDPVVIAPLNSHQHLNRIVCLSYFW
jgi:hypothetical protein